MNDKDAVLIAALLYHECPCLRGAVKDFLRSYARSKTKEASNK